MSTRDFNAEITMTTRKRFIAGAICPHCHALDTLALWREEQAGVAMVKCVKCDYYQRQPDKKASKTIHVDEKIIGMFHVF